MPFIPKSVRRRNVGNQWGQGWASLGAKYQSAKRIVTRTRLCIAEYWKGAPLSRGELPGLRAKTNFTGRRGRNDKRWNSAPYNQIPQTLGEPPTVKLQKELAEKNLLSDSRRGGCGSGHPGTHQKGLITLPRTLSCQKKERIEQPRPRYQKFEPLGEKRGTAGERQTPW